MKIMVVSSPHAYTTRDVWKRVMVGLRANGVDVVPFDLMPRYSIFEWMTGQAQKRHFDLPPAWSINNMACEAVFGAAHYHGVDAVMIVSPQYFPMATVEMLREHFTTIAYFTECPYEDTLVAPIQSMYFDHVFVNDRYSVDLFRTFCPSTHYLGHSFDPELHYPATGDREGVLFVGTGYESRRQFFSSVDWEGIDFSLYGLWAFRGRSRLKKYVKGEVLENETAADLYRQTAVGLSIHRELRYVNAGLAIDEGEAYSVGPRTYEAAACGMFQVSDHRQELIDIFGDSVPIYESPREMERIVRKALRDPAWRKDMAERQTAAVQPYSCVERMKSVVAVVGN